MAKHKTSKAPKRPKATGKQKLDWVTGSDEELLNLRFCDLGLKIEGTALEKRVGRLYDELKQREILLRPHAWLSNEWFSPDGVPGIGIPFYLAHKRLMRLEQKIMLEVEGGTERDCMRLLRHEAGHAMCTAYRLHYKKRWREIFGRFSQPYPNTYKPRPYSRDYVLHLDWWYAQAHPAEDFAETFAVWLQPSSRWRKLYRGWPAMRKLEYVDQLMKDIAGTKPAVRSREHVEPLRSLRTTLKRHYQSKQRRYAEEWPEFYDRDLRRLFADDGTRSDYESAAVFLRRIRPVIRDAVAKWTGEHPYTVDQVLRDMIDRCKELKLRRCRAEREVRTDAMVMVTVQTMNYLHGGHYRIAI